MPSQKPYFHVSQDLNHDEELWAFTQQHGDRAIRTWLHVLAYLHRTNNRWAIKEGSYASLARTVRQRTQHVTAQIEDMLAKGWLVVIERNKQGVPTVLGAKNWTKYYRGKDPAPPRVAVPSKGGRLLADEAYIATLKTNPAYTHIQWPVEMGKMDVWLANNPGRTKSRQFVVGWLNKVPRPIVAPSPELSRLPARLKVPVRPSDPCPAEARMMLQQIGAGMDS